MMASARILPNGDLKAFFHFISRSYVITIAYLTNRVPSHVAERLPAKESRVMIFRPFRYGQEHEAVNYDYTIKLKPDNTELVLLYPYTYLFY